MDLYVITIATPTQWAKLRNKMRMILVFGGSFTGKQNESETERGPERSCRLN